MNGVFDEFVFGVIDVYLVFDSKSQHLVFQRKNAVHLVLEFLYQSFFEDLVVSIDSKVRNSMFISTNKGFP